VSGIQVKKLAVVCALSEYRCKQKGSKPGEKSDVTLLSFKKLFIIHMDGRLLVVAMSECGVVCSHIIGVG
tara:strand:+ start:2543 stop:2752 length:210 start_codon:yes stop_codon:yes gene_type:complete